MIDRLKKEKELIDSGLFDIIRRRFIDKGVYIKDKYIMLIADYIDTLNQLDKNDGLYIDPINIVNILPDVLKGVKEDNIYVHGITQNFTITMNKNNDYETNKLYFFHELTHAIQTRQINNHEECSFYNGHTGMFLAEGATQFTAEILYNISNNTNINYREQPNSVRGLSNHSIYSPLSEYQLNGNIIMLMSTSFGIPLNQILALGFRRDGREQLKKLYETFPGHEGKFEEFMMDLEKIYSIDKLQLTEHAAQIRNENPSDIILMGSNESFLGNTKIENELINKIERNLAANFIANNDEKYIEKTYSKILMYLTTPELKQNFMNAVNEIISMNNEQNNSYEINEFGEIIRPNKTIEQKSKINF